MKSRSESDGSSGALTRRTLLQRGAVAAGALALPGVLQACGGNDSSGATGTIRYIKGPFGEDDRKWIQQTSSPFLKKHPDINLEISLYDWNSRDAQMAAAYASGSPPDVAYLGDSIWVPFAKGGAMEDLTSKVKGPDFRRAYGTIASRFWDASSTDGKIYGVPLYSSSSVMFVNKDLMREAGVSDWTSSMEAVRKAAEQVKQRTGQWGFATSHLFGEGAYGSTILPAIWATGTELYNKDMSKATVDNARVAAQLDIFRKIFVEEDSGPPPGLYDGPGLAGLFGAGKVAIYSYFSDPAPAILADAKFDWELVPMPPLERGADPATYVAVGAAFISSRSEAKEAAWEYVKYMASKPAVDKYRTFVPAVYGCRDDLKPTTGSKPLEADAEYYTRIVVPFGQAIPSIPNGPQAMRGLSSEFELLCNGKETGAEAAKAMNEHLQAGLEF